MTGSVHLKCVDCGDHATEFVEGVAFCEDCAKDQVPMDFDLGDQ